MWWCVVILSKTLSWLTRQNGCFKFNLFSTSAGTWLTARRHYFLLWVLCLCLWIFCARVCLFVYISVCPHKAFTTASIRRIRERQLKQQDQSMNWFFGPSSRLHFSPEENFACNTTAAIFNGRKEKCPIPRRSSRSFFPRFDFFTRTT